MKKLFAAAAVSAALIAGAGFVPAHASEGGVDAGVGIKKTGGILGLFGSGNGYIRNEGTTTLPRGTSVTIEFANVHHHHRDIHATTVHSTSLNGIAVPLSLQKWRYT
ncbi:MAG: hypothetical protein Q4F67_02320, partial [Propionibacteriaceae bacterium]|nr:hypothetical protein [Propionibacteriaceae bacterium]